MELFLLPIVFHAFHENHACSVEHHSCENDIHANGSARMMDLNRCNIANGVISAGNTTIMTEQKWDFGSKGHQCIDLSYLGQTTEAR